MTDPRILQSVEVGQESPASSYPVLPRLYSIVSDCWTLTKPEINFLIALATFTGFYLGRAHQPGPFPLSLSVRTLLGTLLVASGTAILNQYLERRFDALMRRTARRPLAAGRLNASTGLRLGMTLAVAGSILLAVSANLLACALAAFTALTYLLVYTPLKRESPACTFVGAIPGAMPVLIGWTGASGHLSVEAWVLYGILFFWQFPHFMAIAWMYRDDYRRAGYRILPVKDKHCVFINMFIVLPLLLLLPITVFHPITAHSDAIFSLGVLCAGIFFLYHGVALSLQKSNLRARRLLFASIVYLPAVFALLIIGARSGTPGQ